MLDLPNPGRAGGERWMGVLASGRVGQRRAGGRRAGPIEQFAGDSWQEIAVDPSQWSALEEGFVEHLF